jgi:hypothetical protein
MKPDRAAETEEEAVTRQGLDKYKLVAMHTSATEKEYSAVVDNVLERGALIFIFILLVLQIRNLEQLLTFWNFNG